MCESLCVYTCWESEPQTLYLQVLVTLVCQYVTKIRRINSAKKFYSLQTLHVITKAKFEHVKINIKPF